MNTPASIGRFARRRRAQPSFLFLILVAMALAFSPRAEAKLKQFPKAIGFP